MTLVLRSLKWFGIIYGILATGFTITVIVQESLDARRLVIDTGQPVTGALWPLALVAIVQEESGASGMDGV